MIEENHMLDGYFEESTERDEPEFERDPLSLEMIDATVDSVQHKFPLEVRIKGLLIQISETDRVPVELTIEVLHEMLKDIEIRKGIVRALADDVGQAHDKIRNTTYQGEQA